MKPRAKNIELNGVMKNCLAYINGKLVGEHLGCYGGFYFDLTSYINWDKDKLLALEVGNMQVAGVSTAAYTAALGL